MEFIFTSTPYIKSLYFLWFPYYSTESINSTFSQKIHEMSFLNHTMYEWNLDKTKSVARIL